MTTIPTSIHAPRAIWASLLTVIAGTALFDLLFWGRALGANVLLFNGCVAAYLVQRYSWRGISIPARFALIGLVVASAMVVVHNSIVAKIAASAALVLAAVLAHEAGLRSLLFGVAQAAASFMMVPLQALANMDRLTPAAGAPRNGWRWFRLGVLPILVVLLFIQLYRAGNPRFDGYTADLMDAFFEGIGDLLQRLFTPHTLFLLLGASLCAVLLLRVMPDRIQRIEAGCTDRLLRMRMKRPHWMAPRAMDPLERERRMGMILLVCMNVLLAVVNVIDIDWVWFGFEVPQGFRLKQFVHEGTWMLIISILLSMAILMHLFRRNQNFYWRSTGLKALAILWLAQNVVLGISVFLRNYHYISFHGLAYKRIGVIVFLLLVLVGLFTLLIKIRERRSMYYLARVNGWATFVVLIGLTTVDWDSLIVRYNLDHWNQGEIDVDNYMGMSDKVLPMLYAGLDKVEGQMESHRRNAVRWVDQLDIQQFRQELDARRDRFRQRTEGAYWQEWNIADARTARALDAATSKQ